MWNGVITNAGAALLASWATGGTLNLESAWAGSGTVATLEMFSQTALVNPVQQLSIVGENKIENGTRMHLQHSAADAAYTVTQIGIFANIDGGESILFALYQDETGVGIPSRAEMPDFVYVFFTGVVIDNSGNYTVNVDSNALVSYTVLEERLKSIEITLDDTVTENGENAVTGAAVYAFVGGGIPAPTAENAGKALVVDENGKYALGEAGLSEVSADIVTAGTFAGQVQANETAAAELTVAQMRNIAMTNVDPGAGVAVDYPDGTVILVYE